MGFFLKSTKKKEKATKHQQIKYCRHHRCRPLLTSTRHLIFLCSFTIFFIIMIEPGGVKAVDVKVNDYGVKLIKAGDTAMVFYANASHTGSEGDMLITARLRMERCCMLLPPDNTNDCESMKLISGLGMVFRPKDTHILQMYFVNFDLYDREGSCVLRLLTQSTSPSSRLSSGYQNTWDEGPELTIPFKTVLPKPSLLKKLFSGSSKGFRICNTDNYNSLHECSNFDDCLIRYAGKRSLFSKESKECESTPDCGDGDKNFLSIVARKCEKSHNINYVQKTFTGDMKHVDSSKASDAIPFPDPSHHLSSLYVKVNISQLQTPNVICENGVHFTDGNGRPNCTCNLGWRSLTLQEWEQKGGIVDSASEGMIYRRMCTVPLMDQKTKGFIILGIFGACITVPFIGMLIYNQSKRKEDMKKMRSSVKKFLSEEGEESSSSSSDDDHKGDEESRSKKNSRMSLDHEMGEEEAEQVISEITHRREPQLSKKLSKKDDDDNNDDNPPPPPLSSPSSQISYTSSEASQQQKESHSKSNWSIPWSASSQSSKQSMPPAPPPTPAQSTSTTNSQPSPISPTTPPSSKSSSGDHYYPYSPSGGFDYDVRKDDEKTDIKLSDEMNKNQVATQVPSMDDLLSMKIQEMWRAHVPIEPQTGEGRGASVVVADCAIVELKDIDNVTLRSMSSEEITERKKEEWAQFIESVSEENVQLKLDHCSASLKGRRQVNNNEVEEEDDDDDDDDDDEVDAYKRNKQPPPDFSYFHKDHKPKAIKVRSVPGMMQYHRFTSSSPLPPKPDELPQPPPQFIQKAFGEMPLEDLVSRQECYRTLSSLSNERWLSSSQEASIKNTNSIWSNIASENTKQPSTTPATTTEGSRIVSSCEGGVGTEDTSTSIRTSTLYGDMGSDVDSDGALQQLATTTGSSLASTTGHYRYKTVTEEQYVTEDNRMMYGVHHLETSRPSTATSQPVNQYLNTINRLFLKSDTIPSDTFVTGSGDSSRTASHSGSSTVLWKAITTSSGGRSNAPEGASGTTSATSTTADVGDGEECTGTISAYRIKSSLETALKASRSRSKTNLF